MFSFVLLSVYSIRDHPFSAYAKFSNNITFLTLDTNKSVYVTGGQKCYFSKTFFVCTKWIMPDEFLMFNKATYRGELRTGNGDERSKS